MSRPGLGETHEPRCSICQHPDRTDIDKAITEGVPKLRVAETFSVSQTAVHNHLNRHLAAAVKTAAGDAAVLSAGFIVGELERLLTRTDGIIEDARKAGDDKLALDGLNSLRQSVKLCAELAGKIQPEGTTAVHVHTSPDWLLIRAAVMDALNEFPDARAAVAGRLIALGAGDE